MNFIKIGRPMAGGSQIIINKNGITFITPAKFEAKAGQHLFKSGEKVDTFLPKFNPYYSGYYIVRDKETHTPIPNYTYELSLQDGRKIIGKTNNKGETLFVNTITSQKVQFVEPDKKKKNLHQLFVAGSDSVNLKLEHFDEE